MEDVDRVLRCDIMFPDGLITMLEFSSLALDVGFSDCGDPVAPAPSKRVSVGVGGVTVVNGALISADGGVKGRNLVSRFGNELFSGRSRMGGGLIGSAGGSGTEAGSSVIKP